MKPYLDLLEHVLNEGYGRSDRTGTGTFSVFGAQLRFDLGAGFPLVTTKRMFVKGIVHELLWFLHPTQDLEYLHQHDVHIWDEWAGPDGYVGPIYGNQWRAWPLPSRDSERPWAGHTYDQLGTVIDQIKRDPYSRRHLVSAWNVTDLDRMALAPCHVLYQFYVADGRLSCQLYQRSADCFLGLPFNIASYALLTSLVAQVTGLTPGELIIALGDAHVYLNHLEQARLQLTREPLPLPTLWLNPEIRDIDDFTSADIRVEHYVCHPAIKAPIAV